MNRGTVSLPLLFAVIAILVGAYVFRSLGHHQPSPAAQAIMAGKARGMKIVQEPQDKNLSEDEEAAGALWARKHPGERCPGDPAAFAHGCRQTQTR